MRRVAENSVAVWIAMRDAEPNIQLTVWPGLHHTAGPGAVDGGTAFVAQGTGGTRQFGQHLHVAVVVAKANGAAINPGSVYSYDLDFGAGINLQTLGLLRDEPANPRLPNVDADAPLHLALGYELDRLPSFITPAPTLADLCFAHTSCRRTNAPGPDALAFLDDMINEHRSDLGKRPQQLFLTGDQIYADDLAACLLPQVNAIGRELVGFTETLPINNADIPVDLENFPATRRRHLVREIARFSTTDGENHLLSYGEFVALHLLSWSPRLWRKLATADEIFVPSAKVEANHLQDWETKFGSTAEWKKARVKPDKPDDPDAFQNADVHRAEIFRAAVPRVARALANVATYMVFDDHEMTDDWYLSQSWRSQVLTAPFGRAVLRNGYAAYTVCQGWGNDPAAFTHEGAAPKPKNEELLDAVVALGGGPLSTTTRDKLDDLLGMTETLKDPQATFHYSVPGPRHMVRVLDTRSRRRYKGRLGPPKLLGNTMDQQLPAGPLTDGRELLVVVSAAPVLMPRLFDTLIQPLAARLTDFFANVKQKARATEDGPPITGSEEVDLEGWGTDEATLETMIRRLASYPRTIVLGGDVHFGFSIGLDFWNGTDPTVDSRVVQLTSSGARNAAGTEKETVIRQARFSQQLLQGLPFERLGWNDKSSISVPNGKPISPARRTRLRKTPGLLPAEGWPAGTTIPGDKPPDWRWRMAVIRDNTPRAQHVTPAEGPQPPLPGFNAGDPVATYDQIAGVHAQLALSPTELLRTLVFRANIGVVHFEPDGNDHTVVHELWTVDGPGSTEGGAFTKHRASLALTPSLAPPQLQVVADG